MDTNSTETPLPPPSPQGAREPEPAADLSRTASRGAGDGEGRPATQTVPLSRDELKTHRQRQDIAGLVADYDAARASVLAESDGTVDGEAAARRSFIDRARGTTALVVGAVGFGPEDAADSEPLASGTAGDTDKAKAHLLACIECGRWIIGRLKAGDRLGRVHPISDDAWEYLTTPAIASPEAIANDEVLIAPLDLMTVADRPSQGEANRYVFLALAAVGGRWGDLDTTGEGLPASLHTAERELGMRDDDGLRDGWGA